VGRSAAARCAVGVRWEAARWRTVGVRCGATATASAGFRHEWLCGCSPAMNLVGSGVWSRSTASSRKARPLLLPRAAAKDLLEEFEEEAIEGESIQSLIFMDLSLLTSWNS